VPSDANFYFNNDSAFLLRDHRAKTFFIRPHQLDVLGDTMSAGQRTEMTLVYRGRIHRGEEMVGMLGLSPPSGFRQMRDL